MTLTPYRQTYKSFYYSQIEPLHNIIPTFIQHQAYEIPIEPSDTIEPSTIAALPNPNLVQTFPNPRDLIIYLKILQTYLNYDDEDQEDDTVDDELIDISQHEALNRPTILVNQMEELDLEIAFGMKRKLEWSNDEFDILHKELKFLKLNTNYIEASPECQMEMAITLVQNLEQ